MGDFDIHYTDHNKSYDITKLDAYLELKSGDSITNNLVTICENKKYFVRVNCSFTDIFTYHFYEKNDMNEPLNYLGSYDLECLKCRIKFSDDTDHLYVTKGSILYIYDLTLPFDHGDFLTQYDLRVINPDAYSLDLYSKDGIVYIIINLNDDETSRRIYQWCPTQFQCDLHLIKFSLETKEVISQDIIYQGPEYLDGSKCGYGMLVFGVGSNDLFIYHLKTGELQQITIQTTHPKNEIEDFEIFSDNIIIVKVNSHFYLHYINNGRLISIGEYECEKYTCTMERFIIFHFIHEIGVFCTWTGLEYIFNRPDNYGFEYIIKLFPICLDDNSLLLIETRDIEDNREFHTRFNLEMFDESNITDDYSKTTDCCSKTLQIQHQRYRHKYEDYNIKYHQKFPKNYVKSPSWFMRKQLVMCLSYLCYVNSRITFENSGESETGCGAAREDISSIEHMRLTDDVWKKIVKYL